MIFHDLQNTIKSYYVSQNKFYIQLMIFHDLQITIKSYHVSQNKFYIQLMTIISNVNTIFFHIDYLET